jgi:ActR/RegA family two-component response regulator
MDSSRLLLLVEDDATFARTLARKLEKRQIK